MGPSDRTHYAPHPWGWDSETEQWTRIPVWNRQLDMDPNELVYTFYWFPRSFIHFGIDRKFLWDLTCCLNVPNDKPPEASRSFIQTNCTQKEVQPYIRERIYMPTSTTNTITEFNKHWWMFTKWQAVTNSHFRWFATVHKMMNIHQFENANIVMRNGLTNINGFANIRKYTNVHKPTFIQ